MAKLDLVVRHGTLVIPGMGRVRADVGIAGGRIAALGEDLGPAEETLDARGKVVLPGVVDPHVHIGNQLAFEEEAHTETRAAVLGGVTTIGVFLRRLEDSYLDHLPTFRKTIEERSFVDALFHLQIFTEQQLMEIPRCAEDYGIRSFKFYMSGIPNIVPSITDDFLYEGFRRVAGLGPGAIACVHCENGCLVDHAREELKRKPDGTLADWEQAHPPEAEALAIQTAVYLAGRAGAHLYVVHLSSAEGLEIVRACRRAGARFTVETTSPYLGLTSDDTNGFLAKMVPPIRGARNGDELWNGLRDGSINLLGTDNTSRTREAKRPQAGLHGSRPGLPVVGTHLPALLHFGHHLRGVPLELLVECACRKPAEIYGVYPRKGTIAVGSDADLVVVDLDLERVVDAEFLQGMSDFSPFEGKRMRGWPVATVKGGQIVARDGKIVAKPSGRYLPRSPAAPTPTP